MDLRRSGTAKDVEADACATGATRREGQEVRGNKKLRVSKVSGKC
jgi:hypothetical protein